MSELNPQQGHSYVVSGVTEVHDATGPCEIILIKDGDDAYNYTHFDPSQKKEMRDFVAEQQRAGREVRRIGNNQRIEGAVATLYEKAHVLTQVPARWKK